MTITVNDDTGEHTNNASCIDMISFPTGHNMNVMAERLSHIINKIQIENVITVLDIGSMDAWESINLARVFNDATVYTFEPVKANFEICEQNLSAQPQSVQDRVKLQRIALNNTTGPMTFWELDEMAAAKRGKLNRGIGSKYQIMNPDMWPWEHNAQRPVTVVGYRLDDWCKENNVERVDAIWMDAQGAELDILQGAGSVLDTVQFIITEAGLKPYYHGHTMKTDMDQYLLERGFVEWVPARRIAHEYEADVIYLNTRYANF
jgi:2-O-methyltransferase